MWSSYLAKAGAGVAGRRKSAESWAGGLKDHTWCSSRYWRRPSLPLGVTNLPECKQVNKPVCDSLVDLFALRQLLDLPHGLEAFLGCEGVALSLVTPDSLDSPLGLGPGVPLHLVA